MIQTLFIAIITHKWMHKCMKIQTQPRLCPVLNLRFKTAMQISSFYTPYPTTVLYDWQHGVFWKALNQSSWLQVFVHLWLLSEFHLFSYLQWWVPAETAGSRRGEKASFWLPGLARSLLRLYIPQEKGKRACGWSGGGAALSEGAFAQASATGSESSCLLQSEGL